jgi:hypothetical protein
MNIYNTEIDDLYQWINLLKTRLENQEHYSRKTNLRFHNIQIPIDRSGRIIHCVNTVDHILLCNQKLDLGLQKEYISRSHVNGKVRNGKSQIIVPPNSTESARDYIVLKGVEGEIRTKSSLQKISQISGQTMSKSLQSSNSIMT